MSQLGLQIIIVVAFGALCFGCGCLTAFIVTRNQWRGEMIERGFAHYNGRPASGNGESKQVGATRPALPLARPWQNDLVPPLPPAVVCRGIIGQFFLIQTFASAARDKRGIFRS